MSRTRPIHPTSLGPPKSLRFVGSFPGELPDLGLPEVAFAGRSNVGKSSAINTLLQRKKAARVSRTPGRTQAINLFALDERICFADLPGYGFAKVPDAVREAWRPMIERYLAERQALKLVISLVDGRHTAQSLDRQLIQGLRAAQVPFCVVATKIDRVSRSKRKPALRKLAEGLDIPSDWVVPFSSPDRLGVSEVWGRIGAATGL